MQVQLLQSLSRSGDLNLNWSDAEVVADNLLSLNIHFEDLSQEILQELPKYPVSYFSANMHVYTVYTVWANEKHATVYLFIAPDNLWVK